MNPALEKKRAKIAAQFSVATPFKEGPLEWIRRCEREGRAEVAIDKIGWLLGMAYPIVDSLPIDAITRIEAQTALCDVRLRGGTIAMWQRLSAAPSPRPGPGRELMHHTNLM